MYSFLCVYRQQLEAMAEQLKFPSVREFATEIVRRDSPRRLSLLREYYTSLNHSDVTTTITETFPEPDSAQTTSTTATSPSSTKTAARNRHSGTKNQQKESLRTAKSLKSAQRNLKARTKPESPQSNKALPQIRSRNLQNDDLEPPKKQKILQKNVQDPLRDVPEAEEQEEMVSRGGGHKRTMKSRVSSSPAHRTDGGLGVNQASSSGLESGEAAASLSRTHRDTPSPSDLSRRRSKPAGQETEKESKPLLSTRENSQPASTSCHQSLLKDLIGDTSILDDILKPKAKCSQQQNTPETRPASTAPLSTRLVISPPSSLTSDTDSRSRVQTAPQVAAPVQETKSSRKDIWDILNEGNEESINRLTDPEELQRVCVNASFAASRFPKQTESRSLWKTNEKFLWKK